MVRQGEQQMKKPSVFQPDHDGKHAQVPVHPGMTVSHVSHGGGDHVTGHAVKGNIARDGAPKHVRVTPVHGGMTRQVQGQPITGGGHVASALDAISGQTVVPGIPNSTPGYGNTGVQSGHPLAKAPGGKNLKPVAPSFGMRSRGPSPDSAMHEIGEAMIAEAFANSSRDDRVAHGCGGDGRRFPDAVDEN
jgi:hypothetical protein